MHACIHCAAPFGDILCTECRDAPLLVGRCLATATFEGPAARIVRAYKDAGERRLAPFIAQMLWDTALHAERAAPERYAGILTLAQAIVFVPATERAFVRRGFDHMERVAAELAGLSGVSVIDALLKHGAADQRLLGRHARAERAREAYEVVESVRGLRLVLVDDVITTGATVRAAAAALERAGAARWTCWPSRACGSARAVVNWYNALNSQAVVADRMRS